MSNMKSGKWSKEEHNYLRENWIKDGSVKVGKALNRNHRNVGCMANYLGLRSGWGDKPRFRRYAINGDIFKTWTMESAYLVGFILADGNITERAVGISSKDIELLEKAKKAFSSEHPIKKVHAKNLYRLRIGSKKIVSSLKSIGITENKSKTITLPIVPDAFFTDFLRGYIDGDGMIMYRPKRGFVVNITTGSPYILEDLSDSITRLFDVERHSPSTQTGKKGKTISTWYRLTYCGASAARICKAIYHKCDYLFLSRKRQSYFDYRDRPRSLDLRHNGNATKYK